MAAYFANFPLVIVCLFFLVLTFRWKYCPWWWSKSLSSCRKEINTAALVSAYEMDYQIILAAMHMDWYYWRKKRWEWCCCAYGGDGWCKPLAFCGWIPKPACLSRNHFRHRIFDAFVWTCVYLSGFLCDAFIFCRFASVHEISWRDRRTRTCSNRAGICIGVQSIPKIFTDSFQAHEFLQVKASSVCVFQVELEFNSSSLKWIPKLLVAYSISKGTSLGPGS